MEKKVKKADVSESAIFDTPEFNGYLTELNTLRKDGENKVNALHNEIRDLKLNKQIDKETKQKVIDNDKKLIEEAKKVVGKNAQQVKEVVAKAAAAAEAVYKKV